MHDPNRGGSRTSIATGMNLAQINGWSATGLLLLRHLHQSGIGIGNWNWNWIGLGLGLGESGLVLSDIHGIGAGSGRIVCVSVRQALLPAPCFFIPYPLSIPCLHAASDPNTTGTDFGSPIR